MSNVDQRLQSYRDRLLRLESEKRERTTDITELRKEMKGSGLSKAEIAGIVLAVRREFESADKKAARTEAELVADQLALSGTAPLFGAAA